MDASHCGGTEPLNEGGLNLIVGVNTSAYKRTQPVQDSHSLASGGSGCGCGCGSKDKVRVRSLSVSSPPPYPFLFLNQLILSISCIRFTVPIFRSRGNPCCSHEFKPNWRIQRPLSGLFFFFLFLQRRFRIYSTASQALRLVP